ncbi:MAG: DUF2800 domain-containing protein [Roseburia sp.]|nr:DUF2800 domain-containing protein [Roseburia sp.]
MPPNNHSMLSASSSDRWLKCPPFAKLCAEAVDTGSEYAREGTCAHELCEYKVRKMLGEDVADPAENLDFYDSEMEECTESYAQYISEQLSKAKEHCKDPIVLVEQRLDFSRCVPEGFGTGDCVIVADDVLTIIDFKYGKGVEVSALDNPQMKLYALGALELFDSLYDVTQTEMTIFQPRLNNVSESAISKAELLDWSENTLKPIAELAAKGEGKFTAGEHCRFCKVKATCRKRAEYNLELAKYDFAVPNTLENAEISAILAKADELVAWANDVKEYALRQALSGVEFNGFKIVEGRSVRKYKNETMVAETVEKAGFDPYEKSVLGITAMTKLLGKAKFDELLGGLIVKPKGKPTLAPISDKRAAINTAADDFKEEN